MKSNLADRFRAARKAADISQGEIAKVCNVSRPAVTQWESIDPAKRTTPSLDQLRASAKLMGVPLDWLIDDMANPDDVWRVREQFRKEPPKNAFAIKSSPTSDRADFIGGLRYVIGLTNPTIKGALNAAGEADFLNGDAAVQFVLPGDAIDAAVAKLLALQHISRRVLAVLGRDRSDALDAIQGLFKISVVYVATLDEAADLLRSTL